MIKQHTINAEKHIKCWGRSKIKDCKNSFTFLQEYLQKSADLITAYLFQVSCAMSALTT